MERDGAVHRDMPLAVISHWKVLELGDLPEQCEHADNCAAKGMVALREKHSSLGILAIMVIDLGMAALSVHAICLVSSEVYDSVALRVNSAAWKHFKSDISMYQSLIERGVANVSFSTAACAMITCYHACGGHSEVQGF